MMIYISYSICNDLCLCEIKKPEFDPIFKIKEDIEMFEKIYNGKKFNNHSFRCRIRSWQKLFAYQIFGDTNHFGLRNTPAYTGQSSLPFLDLVDLSKIDAIFVTHFHLDHGGALPYITEKTNFNGRVLVSAGVEDSFSDNELKKCMDRIRTIDYYQQIRINDLKITALNAGHVLGAAMFMIQASSSLILYTGDYSREEDRHLKMADLPSVVNYQKNAVCESTYGVGCHLPKEERESRFINEIMKILNRGGRALLPVFALGRAQELLLILEEHWRQHKLKFKIYYVSTLARKCISVYQTYLTMMNANIQKQTDPFNFKYIQLILLMIMSHVLWCALPGMLQSGISRELFDNWCVNDKNGVILTGYSVPGTLAKEILAYISEVNPEKLFLVHGEVNEMHRLKNAITHNNKETYCIILRNGESSTLEIKENENISLPIIKEDVVFKGILVKK
ncbi:hypothetical protein NQ315_002898 [Exocentrus adspersus]|uniref:Uncharacterized protein n=1 Tax=Exocentrus adspersus TaxID=1586481 RepID=A0AAV8V7W0_9CUCU|nr:hypothetical protein NQ315_002898 [Exocentrus adspersus]